MSAQQAFPYNFKEGATLLVDKPLEWTSFDVVNKLRYIIKTKIGHAGTLDPLATGLLIICTGKFTKKLADFQGLDKEYTGSFFLGATTPSYDRETEVDQSFPIEHIRPELIKNAAANMEGASEQLPPMYSAVKVDGKKLYESARKGQKAERAPRPITIHAFEITGIEMPLVHFRIHCSKGTYIRTIAHDFGAALNSGAYLHSLRRTRIGEFDIKDAWNLQELTDYLNENKALFLQDEGISGPK